MKAAGKTIVYTARPLDDSDGEPWSDDAGWCGQLVIRMGVGLASLRCCLIVYLLWNLCGKARVSASSSSLTEHLLFGEQILLMYCDYYHCSFCMIIVTVWRFWLVNCFASSFVYFHTDFATILKIWRRNRAWSCYRSYWIPQRQLYVSVSSRTADSQGLHDGIVTVTQCTILTAEGRACWLNSLWDISFALSRISALISPPDVLLP